MKYTSKAIQSAYAELDRRRQSAISEHSVRISDIQKNYPEIYRVYRGIASTSEKLASVIFSGGERISDTSLRIAKIRDENLAAQKKLGMLLKSFGFPGDYLKVKFTCPKCSDTGVALGDRCECVTRLLNKYTIEELNEQCKIKLHSFSEFNIGYYPETVSYNGSVIKCRDRMAENLRFCMDYAKNFGPDSPGIFMLGPTGLGKTFLSSCIANALIHKGVSVAFDSIQNYLHNIEKEHFGKAEGDTLGALLNAELLIIDDLGCEFSSQFNSASIYNIINSRSNLSKPTIISSNLDMNQLTERYDARIVSRLIGTLHTLRFVGEDIRQIKMRSGIYN